MNNDKYLVIIGNGFDLAHNMNTGYPDFIRYLVELQLENSKLDPPLFKWYDKTPPPKVSFKDIIDAFNTEFMESVQEWTANEANFPNKFFKHLLGTFAAQNWCDIEKEYFEILMECVNSVKEAERLNREFKILKKHLEKYLRGEEEKPQRKTKLNSYVELFNTLPLYDTLILNFNYTNTLAQYIKESHKIVHIHGELFSSDNPIIFGYAADESKLKQLQRKDENTYLHNIKQECYRDANSEYELNLFLDDVNKMDSRSEAAKQGIYGLNILLLGHSSSTSDTFILQNIFRNKKLKYIKIFFYDKIERGYSDVSNNINRIIDDSNRRTLIANRSKCHRMPQHDDNDKHTEAFIQYIRENI